MDSRVRALDLATGKVLWKGLVDAPAVALPAIGDWFGTLSLDEQRKLADLLGRLAGGLRDLKSRE
jgi:PQQ enzyme repeat